MSTPNTANLRKAQAAIKQGQKRKARALLQQAIRQDSHDHRAWAWLASVTPSVNASLDYARRASKLQPDDPLVRKVLRWAERRKQAAEVGTRSGEQILTRGNTAARLAFWRSRLNEVGLALLVTVILLTAVAFAWDRMGGPTSGPANDGPEVAVMSAGPPVGDIEVASPTASATAVPVQPTATPTAVQPMIRAKNIAGARGQDQLPTSRPTWTATPEATDTPTPTPTYIPTFISPQSSEAASRPYGVGPAERWIDVDLGTQTLNAFEGDSLVFNTLISSGTWQHPTVTGQFRIWVRYASQTMDGRRLGYDYYLENVPYVMYFYKDYALHGTYWHNNFGTPMSHGCVNMRTADAEWIYHWSSIGTVVNVHY
jgi:lipoprotein-anchoring transpeptidase ErfK/SrfK